MKNNHKSHISSDFQLNPQSKKKEIYDFYIEIFRKLELVKFTLNYERLSTFERFQYAEISII